MALVHFRNAKETARAHSLFDLGSQQPQPASIHRTRRTRPRDNRLHRSDKRGDDRRRRPSAPELILAPMLKIAIPDAVWSRHLCLIVHPGIKGDRGPSSLDWAIANNEKSWGVSILEAAKEFDAGPIWASHEFALEENPPSKSSLYRNQVTEAAVRGVLEAVARIEMGQFRSGAWQPQKLADVSFQTNRPRRAAVCARRCGRPTALLIGARTRRKDRADDPRGRQRSGCARRTARQEFLFLRGA